MFAAHSLYQQLATPNTCYLVMDVEMEVDRRGRKRHVSGESPRKRKKLDVSTEETLETTVTTDGEIDPTKKKKKRKRRRNDGNEEMSAIAEEATTLSDSDQQPVPATALSSKELQTDDDDVDEVSPSVDRPKKSRGTSLVNPLKPKGNSWLPHIANLVILRYLQRADKEGIDPRNSDDIDLTEWAEHLLQPEDLRIISFYTAKEFPEPLELSAVSESLCLYSKLKPETLVREDIKTKYKTMLPRPPVTAFFQFAHCKMKHLKEKHPELNGAEVSVKLSKKWKSLSKEKQDKYRNRYLKMREQYLTELEEFYTQHPDARPQKVPRKPRNGRSKTIGPAESKAVNLTYDEEIRIKELKQLLPKPPISSYFLFCKAKRAILGKRHPELSSQEVTKKLSQKWKTMSDAKKEKYKQLYLKQKDVYVQEMAKFNAEHPKAQEMLKLLKIKKKSPTSKVTVSVNGNKVREVKEKGKENTREDERIDDSDSDTDTSDEESTR